MRVASRSACFLCGAEGEWLYRDLKDGLFGTPGEWSFRRCPSCGLVWLDPAPIPEDLAQAYETYYTHEPPPAMPATWWSGWIRRTFLRLTLLEHARKKIDSFGLHRSPPGSVLDVGCGDGRRLVRLRELGWRVQGQDVDPRASEAAQRAGITVHLGPLETLQGEFDAVVMSHVIEHVHDPVSL